MAHIKCRYVAPGCDRPRAIDDFPRYIPGAGGWCSWDYTDECSYYKEGEKSSRCIHFAERHYEFETTVKNYEFCDDFDFYGAANHQQPGLRVKGDFYDYEDIVYLEIDERVIIDRREK